MMNKKNVLKGTHTPDNGENEDNTTNPTETDTEYAQGTHPHSKANLKPWKPKQSGNPLGRPSHAKLKKMLKEVGDEVLLDWTGKKELGKYKDLLLKSIWEKAIKGNNIKYVQLLIWLGVLDD